MNQIKTNWRVGLGLGLVIAILIIGSLLSTNTFSPYAAVSLSMSGTGATSSPYLITNCTELQSIKDAVSANFELANDIDCIDTKNWNDEAGFVSIGSMTSMFKGSLDGKGHSIFNLYINTTKTSASSLFSYNKGKISNLNLVDFNITGSDKPAGLVSTNLPGGVISNCYADGTLNGKALSASQVPGMLVATNAGTVTNSRIKSGATFRCIGVSGTAAISYCAETKDVITNPYKIAPSKLSRLVSEQVEVVINPLDIQTGFSSIAPTAVTNCAELQNIQNHPSESFYLTNDIDCTGIDFTPIPSFNGLFDGNGFVIKNITKSWGLGVPQENSNIGLFATTTEHSTITNVGINKAQFVGGYRVGALVGSNLGIISNSYDVNSKIYANQDTVGGLVGYNNGLIVNSYTSDRAVSGWYIYAGGYNGGLVGYNGPLGTILNSYSSGEVSGQGYGLGGLVGVNNGIIKNSFTTMKAFYSLGFGGGWCAASAGARSQGVVIGGLVGINNGTIDNSQWFGCSNMTDALNIGKGSGNIYQKKAETFFSTENPIYNGWDFTSAWKFNTGTYPTPRVNKSVDINKTNYYKINNIPNLVLKNGSGQIAFTEPVTAEGTDLSHLVTITDNTVEIKSDLEPALNKSAIITLPKIIVPNGDVSKVRFTKDGQPATYEISSINPFSFKLSSSNPVISKTSGPSIMSAGGGGTGVITVTTASADGFSCTDSCTSGPFSSSGNIGTPGNIETWLNGTIDTVTNQAINACLPRLAPVGTSYCSTAISASSTTKINPKLPTVGVCGRTILGGVTYEGATGSRQYTEVGPVMPTCASSTEAIINKQRPPSEAFTLATCGGWGYMGPNNCMPYTTTTSSSTKYITAGSCQVVTTVKTDIVCHAGNGTLLSPRGNWDGSFEIASYSEKYIPYITTPLTATAP